jgi:hypothetical protein
VSGGVWFSERYSVPVVGIDHGAAISGLIERLDAEKVLPERVENQMEELQVHIEHNDDACPMSREGYGYGQGMVTIKDCRCRTLTVWFEIGLSAEAAFAHDLLKAAEG